MNESFLTNSDNEKYSIEQEMIEYWTSLLNRPGIKLSDHFFEIGGNSLLAMKLIAYLNSQYQVMLPFAEFMKMESLRQLIEYVTQKNKGNLEQDTQRVVKTNSEVEHDREVFEL